MAESRLTREATTRQSQYSLESDYWDRLAVCIWVVLQRAQVPSLLGIWPRGCGDLPDLTLRHESSDMRTQLACLAQGVIQEASTAWDALLILGLLIRVVI